MRWASSPALRTSARILLLSRGWIFLCAAFAYLTFEPNRAPDADGFDRPELTQPLGGVGRFSVEIWARWDSAWYLDIAGSGYDVHGSDPAFFPLYPLLTRGAAELGTLLSPGPSAVLLAGVLVSLAALGVALYFLYRLVELELDGEVAALSVALLAFSPMAVFFGAVYSESLFLACSIGAVWFARSERWALAGLLGGCAAATRSAGILVIVPLALLYALGPRGVGEGALPYLGIRGGCHPIRRDALWLLLVPAGLAAYAGYLWVAAGDPLRFLDAQDFWHRELARIGGVPLGPVAGLWEGTSAAFQGTRQVLSGSTETVYWTSVAGDPLRNAALNLEAFAFLVFALAGTVGALRRLPVAYGAYAAAAVALPLTFPATTLPLFSFPRFSAVIFPAFVWLALVVRERGWGAPALASFALGLGLFTTQWATWQWVS